MPNKSLLFRIKSTHTYILPIINIKLLITLMPLLFTEAIYFTVTLNKHQFGDFSWIFTIAILNKLLFDSLLFIAIIHLGKKLLYKTLSVFPAYIYLLVILVDTGVYHYGFTHIEKMHFSLVSWISTSEFLGYWVIPILFISIITLFVLTYISKKASLKFSWTEIGKLLTFSAIIYNLDITDYFVKKHIEQMELSEPKKVSLNYAIVKSKFAQLKYLSEYAIPGFIKEMISKENSIKTVNISNYSDIIETFKLPNCNYFSSNVTKITNFKSTFYMGCYMGIKKRKVEEIIA